MHRTTKSRGPLAEALEGRRMMDATAALARGGVFKVTGTDAADVIVVSLTEDGTQLQATNNGTVIGTADVSKVRLVAIDSGAGGDAITVDASVAKPVDVRTGSGNDTIDLANAAPTGGRGRGGCFSVSQISTGDGDDVITVADGNYAINSGGGNDTITAGNGNNRVDAGDGNDTVTVGTGNNEVRGGAGDDVIAVGANATGTARVDGGDGNDTITSNAATSFLYGAAGDDSITGGDGDDTIYGGDGTNTLSGGSGGTDSVNDGDPTKPTKPAGSNHGGTPVGGGVGRSGFRGGPRGFRR